MGGSKTALVIGNSDGIGLATTLLLLARGYRVTGLSRSPSTIAHERYTHLVQDVAREEFEAVLRGVWEASPGIDLCLYCAGIGETLDLGNLKGQTEILRVNLLGAAIATEVAVSAMVKRGRGHFIGLSSIADALTLPDAPGYAASKAGISRYWEGLAGGLKGTGVRVSNIRFGFVDTKMAKGTWKPFLLTPCEAAEFVLRIVDKPRTRATKPLFVGWIVGLLAQVVRIKLLFQ